MVLRPGAVAVSSQSVNKDDVDGKQAWRVKDMETLG